MSNLLFDVIVTGKLLENTSLEAASTGLGKLFKISDERANQLLTSAPKVIKAGLDKSTAEKYQAAITALGVEVVIKAQSVSQMSLEPTTESSETLTNQLAQSSDEQAASPAIPENEPAAPITATTAVSTPETFKGYTYSIHGRPDFAFLKVQIPANQTLKVEASAMATMDTHLEMKTKMRGGLSRLLTSESIFVNDFTAKNAPAEIGIAPASPGDLVHRYLNGETIYLQNSAFVACTPEVAIETKWQGLVKGFFSGEALFLIRASGVGDLWFNSYGAIMEIDVEDGYVVDTGNIVAFTEGLEYSISKVGGYKSLFFSGEGFVCRFSGKGKIWIQTRSVGAFTSWANFYRPVSSS